MTTFRALFLRNAAVATLIPLLMLGLFLRHDQEVAGRQAIDRELWAETSTARQLLAGSSPERLQRELLRLDRTLGIRVTVIAPDGRVLADSESDAAHMENHLQRPEVQQALRDGIGTSERHSATIGRDMRYLAIADASKGSNWIFRAAVPMTTLETQLRRTELSLGLAFAAVVLLALFVAERLSRQLVHPVEALSEAAARFSAGDTQAHVIPDGPTALQRLGRTFNEMVGRLNSQVTRLDEAQGYLDAIIRQMPPGLLVVDSAGRVARANPAAEEMLQQHVDRMLGRPILQVLLSYALDSAVRQVLEGEPGSGVDVRTPEGRSLRVVVGALRVRDEPAGAVVLLQDVSELRRADDMRRDFVANVSHELRTPAAAIRALAETLQLRGERRPELLQEYLPRIVTECERIDRLVEDLLLLAQTEAGALHLGLEPIRTGEVGQDVLCQVQPVAEATGTTLELEAFTDTPAVADRVALGQCVRNLVDNAVRYAAGGVIRIGSRVEGNRVVIYVADDGPGIPPEDLPRIFERFYRVDKGRSRDVGGSGLGLSIVRHLTEAQGGRAWVESRLGGGSTFYIGLPAGSVVN